MIPPDIELDLICSHEQPADPLQHGTNAVGVWDRGLARLLNGLLLLTFLHSKL